MRALSPLSLGALLVCLSLLAGCGGTRMLVDPSTAGAASTKAQKVQLAYDAGMKMHDE